MLQRRRILNDGAFDVSRCEGSVRRVPPVNKSFPRHPQPARTRHSLELATGECHHCQCASNSQCHQPAAPQIGIVHGAVVHRAMRLHVRKSRSLLSAAFLHKLRLLDERIHYSSIPTLNSRRPNPSRSGYPGGHRSRHQVIERFELSDASHPASPRVRHMQCLRMTPHRAWPGLRVAISVVFAEVGIEVDPAI